MFRLTSQGVYVCEPLLDLKWLDHGFGTRASGGPDGWLAGRPLMTLKQVHSATVLEAGGPGVDGSGRVIGEGDGIVVREPGVLAAIRTADCLPVLLVEERLRVVALLHSGWRGTAAGIVSRAVELLAASGGSPDAMRAAIGPGIGGCCYEVGPEVSVRFGLSGTTRLNLEAEVGRQLELSGIERLYRSGLCTSCRATQFWSYRRDGGGAGRMWSAAGIRH